MSSRRREAGDALSPRLFRGGGRRGSGIAGAASFREGTASRERGKAFAARLPLERLPQAFRRTGGERRMSAAATPERGWPMRLLLALMALAAILAALLAGGWSGVRNLLPVFTGRASLRRPRVPPQAADHACLGAVRPVGCPSPRASERAAPPRGRRSRARPGGRCRGVARSRTVFSQPSASAARMRAQDRAPLRKLSRSYFSFGLWMRSFARPKPTLMTSMPSFSLRSRLTGIDPPEPI
jgi:hypothetical protein